MHVSMGYLNQIILIQKLIQAHIGLVQQLFNVILLRSRSLPPKHKSALPRQSDGEMGFACARLILLRCPSCMAVSSPLDARGPFEALSC